MAASEFLGLQYILEIGVWSTLFSFFIPIHPQASGLPPPSKVSHFDDDFSVFAITQQLAGARSVLGTS